jgi:hypothetical protein
MLTPIHFFQIYNSAKRVDTIVKLGSSPFKLVVVRIQGPESALGVTGTQVSWKKRGIGSFNATILKESSEGDISFTKSLSETASPNSSISLLQKVNSMLLHV